MTDYTIPRANAPIAGQEAPTTQWYNFLRYLDTRTAGGTGDVQAEIDMIAVKLGSPDGTVANIPPFKNISSFDGVDSISVTGDTILQFRLVNDAAAVGPIYYYGTDSTGKKGYNLLYSAFSSTTNIAKTNTAGIVSFDLTDLTDSGAGVLLATTFDAKGRKTGSRAATITGTAGRITVANGDASAGLPTLDLATVADAGGGTLLRFVRDAWGRISGTSAATTTDLAEGGNLYFTTARVLATVLSGLSTASSAVITAADSVLVAFGKLQGQITTLAASLTGYVPTSRTISTTAPLTGGGDLSTNRTIAIPAATTSIDGYLTSANWTTFNAKVAPTRAIATGTGLSGGGDLSADRTLSLANTAVAAGSYGDATHVATFTVDAQGRLTAAAAVAISGGGSVSSVFGRSGAVVAASGDYTFAQIGSTPTTLAGYGITDAQAFITAGTTAQYWRGDKTWRDFATDVRAAVITGLSLATSTIISATDTVLVALGKLQAQITNNLTPPGYIDGLELQYGSSGSLNVLPGSAYIPSLGYAINLASTATISFSGTATGWWYVYLYLSGSTPTVELSSTAPSAPYSGSATGRTKTGDTSRRYLGQIYRTGALAAYSNFLQSANHVRWLTTTVSLVSHGTSTSYTSGGLISPVTAGACPSTAREIDLRVINSDNSFAFTLSNQDSGYVALIGVPQQTLGAYFSAPLSQQSGVGTLNYAFSSTPSSGDATIVATGYTFER